MVTSGWTLAGEEEDDDGEEDEEDEAAVASGEEWENGIKAGAEGRAELYILCRPAPPATPRQRHANATATLRP